MALADADNNIFFSDKYNMMLGKKLEQLSENDNYALLGYNGELIVPERNTFENQRGIRLCFEIKNGSTTLWLPNLRFPLANINKDGDITINKTKFTVYNGRDIEDATLSVTFDNIDSSIPEFPTKWKFMNDEGNCVMPPEGTVLSKSIENNITPMKMPKNSKGWMLLGLDDSIISINNNNPIPPNAIYMLPSNNSNYYLLHGGPLHSGKYARINEYGIILYGSNDKTFPKPNSLCEKINLFYSRSFEVLESQQIKSYWPAYADKEKRHAELIPYGYSFVPYLDSSKYVTFIVENGYELETIVRQRPIQ